MRLLMTENEIFNEIKDLFSNHYKTTGFYCKGNDGIITNDNYIIQITTVSLYERFAIHKNSNYNKVITFTVRYNNELYKIEYNKAKKFIDLSNDEYFQYEASLSSEEYIALRFILKIREIYLECKQ